MSINFLCSTAFMILMLFVIVVFVIGMIVGFYDPHNVWHFVSAASIMAILLVMTGLGAKSTNTRVKKSTIPIVKVTSTHYVIRKNGGLEYHKLPNSYRITSGKSRIQKTNSLDFYITAKNQDKIGTIYYINSNQK